MAPNLAASASSSANASAIASNRVRNLWQAFEKTLSTPRSTMDHKVQAAKAKADSEHSKTPAHLRAPQAVHEENKARVVKGIRTAYFEEARRLWQVKLEKAGLRAENWIDMTPSEMESVVRILGDEDESDEDMVVVAIPSAVHIPPTQHFYSASANFLQPVAPSISTSTRASNASSASSYAVVNPNEFHSEDEDYLFHPHLASSLDHISDDDDRAAKPRRVDPFGSWSTDSLGSSLQNSVDSSSDRPVPRPLASDFAYNTPYGRASSSKYAADQKGKEAATGTGKNDVRQLYVGPLLIDTDDTLSDDEDLERFKMQTRMQKIMEFHKAAALAEIQLSIEIYRSKKSQSGDKLVSSLVSKHQKSMAQLQTDKEEERKETVKVERSKRRSDLRTRPGRSNTIIAPTPSAPTNPSWLNALQDDAPAEVETSLDLEQMLSDDPNERAANVEQFLQKMFPFPAATPSFGNPVPAQTSTSASYQSAAQYNFNNQRASSSSSSLQPNAVAGSSVQASQPHSHKRRPSNAGSKAESKFFRPSSRPSPFGEDASSDEEDSPPEHDNPFMDASVNALLASHLQEQPDIAEAFAQYTGMTEGKNSPPSFPSWGARLATQTPSVPSAGAWPTKDVRATPVASGWNRKKAGVATPQPSIASFKNPFGLANETESVPAPFPAVDAPMSANAKGKRPMVASEDQPSLWGRQSTVAAESQQPIWGRRSTVEPEEQQPVWGEPVKKASPPVVAQNVSSSKPIPPVPTKVEKPTPPAPAPALASKKQTKKQRQANKKGGGAATAATAVDEPEAEPEPAAPAAPESTAELDSSSPGESAHENSESMFSLSSMARMVPGMSRMRKDSVGASAFSGWESETVSTPRPPSKIPAHLQESASFKPEGTPRPSLFKKHQISESALGTSSSASPLSQGTIKASQWGSASNTSSAPANRSLWGIFTSDPAPPKVTQQSAGPSSSERDSWLPGGFGVNATENDGDDGGGGEGEDENENDAEADMADTQQFWKPVSAKTTSVPTKPQAPSAAQRLRRMSESVAAPPAPAPAPVRAVNSKATVGASQPQPIPSANSKKGKGKKNGKGKKATVEEVADEEEASRGERLPVDSRTILEDSNPILEPKPSVPPALFDSIISYTDDDEDEEAMFSSFAPTPSTAASSPPDLFGGDEARIAAAVKELQEGTMKLGKIHGTSAWGSNSAKGSLWTSPDAETKSQNPPISLFGARATPAAKPTVPQTPAWGQLSSKDKGKGKMTDSNGGEESTKPANPTIQNLKRNKAAGGKLL